MTTTLCFLERVKGYKLIDTRLLQDTTTFQAISQRMAISSAK